MVERELGETLPFSIATAVPFEKIVSNMDYAGKGDAIFFNVKTLWRNFWGAYSSEGKPNVREVIPAFIEEARQLQNFIHAGGRAFYFYVPQYRAIERVFPLAKFRKEEKLTPKQKVEAIAEHVAITALMSSGLPISNLNYNFPAYDKDVWMITHHPIDLLQRYQFKSLHLLESHTGTLKNPMEWNSKIIPSADYVRIPFNVMTLQVFGDGVNFLSGPPAYKKALKELAEVRQWTPLTTKIKIIDDLGRLADKTVATTLKKMFDIQIPS